MLIESLLPGDVISTIRQAAERWSSLLYQLLIPRSNQDAKAYFVRLLFILPLLALFLLIQLIHYCGFLIDDIFFRKNRDVRLVEPLFILGVPRSGTSHLHNLLSHDSQFTTVRLWEALLAPSIAERHLYTKIAKLDRSLGSPFGRLLKIPERWLKHASADIHPLTLTSAEEDFLLLLPSLDCFLLVLVFPDCPWLWAQAKADSINNKTNSKKMLHRYHRCLQRHMYFHGTEKRLLSKNASFAGIANSLADYFPDALIIVCERDAQIVVKSQLRSIRWCRDWLHIDQSSPEFQSRLLETLHFYYQNLDTLKKDLAATRVCRVTLWSLSKQPGKVITHIYQHFNLGPILPLLSILDQLESSGPSKPVTVIESSPRASNAADPWLVFSKWRHPAEFRL